MCSLFYCSLTRSLSLFACCAVGLRIRNLRVRERGEDLRTAHCAQGRGGDLLTAHKGGGGFCSLRTRGGVRICAQEGWGTRSAHKKSSLCASFSSHSLPPHPSPVKTRYISQAVSSKHISYRDTTQSPSSQTPSSQTPWLPSNSCDRCTAQPKPWKERKSSGSAHSGEFREKDSVVARGNTTRTSETCT